jgi:hypothetical protein
MPSGAEAFRAGEVYSHGGLSPQECVIPDIIVHGSESIPFRGVRIPGVGFGFEESEPAVPKTSVIRPRRGFLAFVDEDKRVGDLALGNSEKRVARFSRVPAPVGAAEYAPSAREA